MTIFRAFAIVLGSAVGFAFAGAALGVVLAVATPDYYPTVFGAGRRGLVFDPIQMGVALGLTQGTVCGIIVGLVVVLAVAIASRRGTSSPAETGLPRTSFQGGRAGDSAPSSTAVRKPPG